MSEWEQRQLCPDGGCVGVIGADGTCKVCGRAAPNWGDERRRGLNEEALERVSASSASEDEDDEDDDDDEDEGDEDEGDEDGGDGDDDDDDDDDDEADEGDDDNAVISASAGSPKSGEWDNRTLCPDGGCVGVIADDGKCSVCGRSPD